MNQQLFLIFLAALTGTLVFYNMSGASQQVDKPSLKAAKCPFGYSSDESTSNQKRKLASIQYPSDVFTCPFNPVSQTLGSFQPSNYEDIVKQIVALYEQVTPVASGNSNPRARFAGCTLRLAGHDLMDYRKVSSTSSLGGSDGCINFNDGDNAGLLDCINENNLNSVYRNVCTLVSLADFIVIAAEAVMGRTATTYNSTNYFQTGSLAQQLRDSFQYGRVTSQTCSWNIGYMPSAEIGCASLEQVFVNGIYSQFNATYAWQMTAAISGAHTLGAAHSQYSGYTGYWSDIKNSGIFNNDYYRSLLLKGWMPKTNVNGKADHNYWVRSDSNNNTETLEMMLTSDMCLAYKYNPALQACIRNGNVDCSSLLKSGTYLNATAGSCCAWVSQGLMVRNGLPTGLNFCGTKTSLNNSPADRNFCCKNTPRRVSSPDCDSIGPPNGPAFPSIAKYAISEKVWLNDYLIAWHTGTQNGFTGLKKLVTSATK